MLVSILIVTYNSEKFIKKTLMSCINQDYKNKEILILDNNSRDSTKKILKEYSKKNKFIKVFYNNKNLGPYAGLNYLIKKSHGGFIAIQDHDDIWLPTKITKQIKFLLKHPNYVGVGTNAYTYFEKNEIFLAKDRSGITNCVVHTSLLFRNIKVMYKIEEALTDEYFQKQILSRMGKIYCLKEFLTIRRIRGDGKNLSSSRFRLTFDKIRSFYRTNGLNLSSIIYLTEILISPHIPAKLPWFVKKYQTLKGGRWITLQKFTDKHRALDL